jgi:CheY-like chemotaxis protein
MINTSEWIDRMLPKANHVSIGIETDIRGGKILLVEDNEINIRVAKLHLSDCGYTDILIARSGQQALELFSCDLGLVLLDIGLPDISGLEVCRKMRRLLKGKPLPIIAYTATADSDISKYEKAGIDNFLVKPVMLNEFKSMIQRYLN